MLLVDLEATSRENFERGFVKGLCGFNLFGRFSLPPALPLIKIRIPSDGVEAALRSDWEHVGQSIQHACEKYVEALDSTN